MNKTPLGSLRVENITFISLCTYLLEYIYIFKNYKKYKRNVLYLRIVLTWM